MAQQSLFRDTIFALSSGRLPAGVAVIRISGGGVRSVLEKLTGGIPPHRRAVLREIMGADGKAIDRGLALFFQGPASFTGEDCAELHVHGGMAVVAALLDLLGAQPGLRMAEAGEFTRRAFLNGKIDLTGAEALSDLISAETETQRRMALANAEGGQRELYTGWRRRLVHARAMLEAELDFADEADVPGSVSGAVWLDLESLAREMVAHVDGFRTAEMIREGFRVALVGAPNAGKSSLLNALARRDVAIVSEVPGTTRDLVEVALDLNGIKVLVTDTAGLRESADTVEKMGIDRARAAADRADLVVVVADPWSFPAGIDPPRNKPILKVATKADLGDVDPAAFDHVFSTKTGKGMADLVEAIAARAGKAAGSVTNVLPSRARHVQLLKESVNHIGSGLLHRNTVLELAAEELRLASDALGRITGAVDVEDLLDVIFSQFCIGK